jgi:hypothetical protein
MVSCAFAATGTIEIANVRLINLHLIEVVLDAGSTRILSFSFGSLVVWSLQLGIGSPARHATLKSPQFGNGMSCWREAADWNTRPRVTSAAAAHFKARILKSGGPGFPEQ